MSSQLETVQTVTPDPPRALSPPGSTRNWIWVILAAGTLLRLVQYLSNRSLWYDETLLALNIIHRPWSGLLKTLDYNQGAPIGFLLLEKLSSQILGKSELALRALPLLAGIGALFLFWRVAKICLSPKALLIGLGLFALSWPLIYYSSEVKQYSTDVTVNLLLLWMLLDSGIPKSAYRPIRLGIAGAVAVWFSHPASFVLAGAGITWTLLVLARREWRSLSGLLPLLAAWSLSFAAFYLVSLRGLSQSPILLKYWDAKFLPWPLWSLRNIPWVFDHFLVLLRSSAGLTDILGAALFVAGCGALFLTSKPTAALLTLPAAVALLASALHRYPIEARFMLFFVPNLLLLVAEGTVWIGDKVRYFSLPVTAVLITALFAQPVLVTGHELLWPYYPDHIKPVIVYMRSNAQPGDGWFIYQSARYQFLYYAELYHLPLENVVTGPDCGGDSRCYTANLDGFANKRVWVLFSHIMIPDGVREERLFLQHLDHVGRRLEVHNSTDARAYLYDLSAPPAPGDR